ncbi:hypothetical protein NAEGRDRAFT_46196 [Naegleria gruberi]|uniref:F-box domain-containing protein n=1 Tax=Naegleria gruberi TaxID=5762 RepID=D2V2L9_NAEGR|nr:uncharacterized protein NAEGRDRAFT_46196 [Naegleria gruberi]EFC48920.1 hypothetical protein NAEGRDRAFT_46196 [Naegleria gruberi]|eukprot:XP_002681664.1 hypothetical protein NAEGRDRAFT_46196 [Naegleria gruberi strain NEG-M]
MNSPSKIEDTPPSTRLDGTDIKLEPLHLSSTEENDVSSQSSQLTTNSDPNSITSPTTSSSDSLPSPTTSIIPTIIHQTIHHQFLDILHLPEELQIYIIQFCTPLERFQVICRISKHFYNLIFSHKGWSCVVGSMTSPHIKDISSCIFDCAWFSKKKKLHTLAVGLSSSTSGEVTASASVGRRRRAILQARLPSNNGDGEQQEIVINKDKSDETIENLFSKCNFEHIEVNCSTVPSTRLLLSYAKEYCKYLKTLIFGYNYHVDIKDLIENILIPFSNQLENLHFSFQWDSSIIYNGQDTLKPTSSPVQDLNVKPQLLFSPKGIPFFASPQSKKTEEKPKPATISQLPIVDCFTPSFELTKLKILDIFIGNSSAIAKQFFIKVCQSSPNLRVCKLKGDIQIEMLLSLSKFCRYLEVLILYNTGKEKLTDESISDMLKIGGAFNMSLRVLSLSCPSLTLRSIALITKFCKNLQYFAISSLDIKRESNNDYMTFHKLEQLKVLKVKDEMNHANWLSDRLLKCLSSDIEYIQVPVPTDESDVTFTLSSEEISFKKLKNLRLTQINSETFPNFFLGGCANNLQELYLEFDNTQCSMLNQLKLFVPQLVNLTTLTLEMSEFDSTLFTILSHLPNLRRLYIKTRGNIEKYEAENGWKLKRLMNLDTLVINSASISQFFTEDFIISLNNLVMIWLACPVNCKAIIDHEELSEEDKLNISVENVIRCCDQYIHDHFDELSQEEKLEMKKEIKHRLMGDTQYEYKFISPKPNILMQKHFCTF